MKNYVQKSKSMTTYDAPAPYGERQINWSLLMDFEAEILDQLKHFQESIGEFQQELLIAEIEHRQAFLAKLRAIEEEHWGR